VLLMVPQVRNGSRTGHKYLTLRMVLANLGEICAHGGESGRGGSAAQYCSKRVFRVSTRLGRKPSALFEMRIGQLMTPSRFEALVR
jgi:hypothetical protein